MGLKFRWGVFKGARGGGFGVGRFKRGADLEHNHLTVCIKQQGRFSYQNNNIKLHSA